MRIWALGLAILVSWSCATPVPPTGGPRDTTPPFLLETVPIRNAVNFHDTSIRLTFSEKVDRASFQQSLTFTPAVAVPPEIDWDGESVDLNLRMPLRDSTTYILTLDKQLKDYRGVSLNQPITLAFSTGPVIDKGVIAGRVAEASTDADVEGLDVLAFESGAVDSAGNGQWRLIGAVPTYRTQTDSDGEFTFANLPDRPFAVVAVEDRNRNRIVDSTETTALPEWGFTEPDTTVDRRTWYLARPDQREPSLTGIQSLSSSRTELRFSEPVRLDTLDPAGWVIEDTLGGRIYEVTAVYQPVAEPSRVTLVSGPLAEGGYRLAKGGAVSDTAGNRLQIVSDGVFSSTSKVDTLALRFVGFAPNADPETGVADIGSGMRPDIQFNKYVEPGRLGQLVTATVIRSDSTMPPHPQPEAQFATDDGTSWKIGFEPAITLSDTLVLEISGVEPPDTTYRAVFAFLDDGSTGSVTGVVETDIVAVVELFGSGPRRVFRVETDSTGSFSFPGMLRGSYRLRVFEDRDRSSSWTPGSLEPFNLPEPLHWHSEHIAIRKGWESAIDTVRFQQ